MRDKFLLKQTLNFIRCFNDGTLPEEKIIAYRECLRSDKKWAEKELEHVLVLLDSTVNVSQSTRLAKFYQAYVRGAIKWDKFCELSEANLRIFEDDVRLLEEIDKNIGMKSDYRALRLLAVGLLNESRPSVTGMTMNLDCTYYVSKFGAEFLYCLRESGEV